MLTIISNIRDLEATGTVGLACLEVDPELPGAGCEGDGALIGLAGLICGNGGWGGWEGKQQVRSTAELGERNHATEALPCACTCLTPQDVHIVSHCPGLVPQVLFDIQALT